MTISQQLIDVNNAKQSIKAAIEAKGVSTAGVPFTQYGTKIGEIEGGGGVSYNTWTRNPGWLTVPTIGSEEKIYFLIAVDDNDSNITSFTLTNLVNVNYTVDWGDGTVESRTQGSYWNHTYDYASINPATEVDGYRQVLVSITPETEGVTTSLKMDFAFGGVSVADQSSNILEMHINLPNTSTFYLSGTSQRHDRCEYVKVYGWNTQSYAGAFLRYRGLRKVDLPATPTSNTPNSTATMFSACRSLIEPPLFDTSAVTNMEGMFQDCTALQTIPEYNTANVTNMNFMFQRCLSLREIPLLNTASVTSMQSMFEATAMLETIPALNTSNVTNMSTMFATGGLKELPLIDTSSVTNWYQTFRATNIESLPELDFTGTTTNTTTYGMFWSCYSLKTLPASFANITTNNAYNMFNGCESLVKVPGFSCPTLITARAMFSGCYSLVEVGNIDFSNITSSTNALQIFLNCQSLRRFRGVLPKANTDMGASSLGPAALDEIYTNAPTVTAATLTVTNNWGNTADDPSIATAKGWTVNG
jgi:surface protein